MEILSSVSCKHLCFTPISGHKNSIFHKYARFCSKSQPDCGALSPWADIQTSSTACVPLTAPESSTAPTLRAKVRHQALCKHTRPDQQSGMPHLRPHKCPSGGKWVCRPTDCNRLCCHHLLQSRGDVMQHELPPAFEQLNMLKQQITDNSAAHTLLFSLLEEFSGRCRFSGYQQTVC